MAGPDAGVLGTDAGEDVVMGEQTGEAVELAEDVSMRDPQEGPHPMETDEGAAEEAPRVPRVTEVTVTQPPGPESAGVVVVAVSSADGVRMEVAGVASLTTRDATPAEQAVIQHAATPESFGMGLRGEPVGSRAGSRAASPSREAQDAETEEPVSRAATRSEEGLHPGSPASLDNPHTTLLQ